MYTFRLPEIAAQLLNVDGEFALAGVCSLSVQGRYGCCRFLRDGHKTPKEVKTKALLLLRSEPNKLQCWC